MKVELYNDHFQNYKVYGIPKAQLVIADIPKIHTTQKPVKALKRLIEIFTDIGDTVIDPCAGSGTMLRAAAELGRNAYGFEIKKDFYSDAKTKMLSLVQPDIFAVQYEESRLQKRNGFIQANGQLSLFTENKGG